MQEPGTAIERQGRRKASAGGVQEDGAGAAARHVQGSRGRQQNAGTDALSLEAGYEGLKNCTCADRLLPLGTIIVRKSEGVPAVGHWMQPAP